MGSEQNSSKRLGAAEGPNRVLSVQKNSQGKKNLAKNFNGSIRMGKRCADQTDMQKLTDSESCPRETEREGIELSSKKGRGEGQSINLKYFGGERG